MGELNLINKEHADEKEFVAMVDEFALSLQPFFAARPEDLAYFRKLQSSEDILRFDVK